MDDFGGDSDRQCTDAGDDWVAPWMDRGSRAAGDSGDGSGLLLALSDGICRGSIASALDDKWLAMVGAESSFFWVVDGGVPRVSWGDAGCIACGHSRSASPN